MRNADACCPGCRVDFLLVLKRKPAPAAATKLPSPPPRAKDRPRDGDRPRGEGRPSERHGERSAARPSDRDRGDRRGSDRGGRGSPARRRRSPSPRRRCVVGLIAHPLLSIWTLGGGSDRTRPCMSLSAVLWLLLTIGTPEPCVPSQPDQGKAQYPLLHLPVKCTSPHMARLLVHLDTGFARHGSSSVAK